ncbi:CBS domain-containing protein [Halomarina ordinaria]|uniref:Cyclic nucleotide-binding/CBS domain-containing protein n=1 Tax=Halomarina ordinaria TaxID=3033939 RepID=A0ABD5UBZ9_9EURY|nr:CBS domain-containing protein [Halomarina sp. PSRA2]
MDLDNRIRAEEVMSTPLETISSKATVREAARTMRDNDINALLVTTGPPSIVTSTDVLDAVAAGHDTADLPVAEVMTRSVETVPPTILLEEVAAMMTSLGIKHLPVVDGEDYVGMVSSTDVTSRIA